MTRSHCPSCQTAFRVPAEKVGKRVRCRRCGTTFTIAAETSDPPPGTGYLEFESPPSGSPLDPWQASQSAQPGPAAAAGATEATEESADEMPRVPLLGATRVYVREIGRTLLLMARPQSLVVLAIVCVICSLQLVATFALCFALPMQIILAGWYLAYLLNVVVSGTANEDALPSLTMEDGVIEGILYPLLKFVAIAVLSMVPLGLMLLSFARAGELGGLEALEVWVRVLQRDFSAMLTLEPEHQLAAWLMLGLGVVFQPIMLLVVAVDTIRSLLRIDLMARTIIRTAPGYAVLLVLTLVTNAAPVLLTASLGLDAPEAMLPRLGEWFAWSVAVVCAGVLLSVLQMRATGLYYHFFKTRFAWSWG